MCAEEFRDEKSERERTSVRKEINIEKFNSQNKSFNGDEGGQGGRESPVKNVPTSKWATVYNLTIITKLM